MIRIRPKLIRKLLSYQTFGTVNRQRLFSSQGSGRSKFPLFLATGAILTPTLALVYAKFDKDFADQLVSYAPFLKSFLEEDTKSNSKFADDNFRFPPQKKPVEAPVEKAKKVIPLGDGKETAKKENAPVTQEKKTPTSPSSSIKSDEKKPEKPATEPDLSVREENLKAEVEKSLQKIEGKRELEDEFRGQLKRLLHAFNEFYEEKRILYETEAKRIQETELKNQLLKERAEIAGEYEKSFKKLKEMEQILKVREQLDQQEMASKKLWILSQSLAKLLEHNPSLSQDPMPIDIQEKINCIRIVVKENFPEEKLIQSALGSLPEDAVKHGIYSEEDLVMRYQRVHELCDRLGLLTDDYNSVFDYLKSYAYSYIRPVLKTVGTVSTNEVTPEELEGKIEIDPSEWDIYDILLRMDFCVQHRNLEMAIRYANLLSGVPYDVAKDWIKDTQEYLEVKQALDLVQAKIASMNLHQLSFSI